MITAVTTSPAGAAARTDRDDALRDLYLAHYTSLLRLAALLVDDRTSAEDVVQESFLKLHRSWHRVRDEASAPAYLRSIVLNTARSGLRRRRTAARHVAHDPPAPPDAAPAEEAALLREDQREVLDALRGLPRRQRECLALRYYLDLSEAEIAAALGISAGAVKSHSHRGIAALATKLEARR